MAAAVNAAYEDDGKTVKMKYKNAAYACVMHMDEWLQKKDAKRKRRQEDKNKGESEEGSQQRS